MTRCTIGAAEASSSTNWAQATLTVSSTSGVYLKALSLSTAGGSGRGAVTYTVANGTSSGCLVSTTSPYMLTSTRPGTCIVTATKAGDVNYKAVKSVATTVTFVKALQAVLLVTSKSGPSPLALTASGGSGTGAVTYTVTNGTATGCVITSASSTYTLTSTSLGTCNVTATKAADVNYQAQPSLVTAVSMTKAVQANLVVTSTKGVYLTPLALTTGGGTGAGAVTYAATNGTASGCKVSAAPYKLSSTTAGTCIVTATRAGDANYLVVRSVATPVTLT